MIDIDAALEDLETNPQCLQMVSTNETVVVVSFNTQIGEVSGMINFCILTIILEPLISNLSVRYWNETGTKKTDPETFEQLEKHIRGVEVEGKALLGTTSITVEQLLDLQDDDVILLDQSIESPLKMLVNDKLKMLVQPGKVH